jgi:hypothetical protein
MGLVKGILTCFVIGDSLQKLISVLTYITGDNKMLWLNVKIKMKNVIFWASYVNEHIRNLFFSKY